MFSTIVICLLRSLRLVVADILRYGSLAFRVSEDILEPASARCGSQALRRRKKAESCDQMSMFDKSANKSLQATRDGWSSSASRAYSPVGPRTFTGFMLVGPACLSSGRWRLNVTANIAPMKYIFTSFLILAATTFVANARFIGARPFEEMEKSADTIVVAKPVSTKDTDEQTNLSSFKPPVPVVGLSSEFEVGLVLKGDNNLKKLVVHHYRLADHSGWNEFHLASFDPKDSTNYLLFLKREPDGRYAPLDQVDPAWTSILKLSDAGWDKMKLQDYKEWLDAKKWLRESPWPPGVLSPEITPEGRGDGSLHEAAMNGKLEKAKALIKANPDLVNSQASYGKVTPLQLAAQYGHRDVAELVLANKADVEAKSYGGWTALLNAVHGGHKDMVELLLTNKADVNYKEDAGRTPLQVAAENGYTEIAAFLIANKADVNAKDRDGITPLHTAVALGHKDFVQLLLANKAEINAKDNRGRTPLGFAVLHNNNDIAELLRQHGGLE